MAKKSAKRVKKKDSPKRKSAAKAKAKRPSRRKAARKTSPPKTRPASRPRKKAARNPAGRGAKATARKSARPAIRSRKRPGTKSAGAAVSRKTASRKPGRAGTSRDFRGRAGFELESPEITRGLGPETGGQSGDTEGLSRSEVADSESVEELLEEGQAYEAGIVSGVENAPDADESEVRTRQVPEDDVPQEYLDED